MGQSRKYVDVVLPLAVGEFFTYGLPSELVDLVRPGHRVMVQFGRKRIYSAIVWRIHNLPPREEIKEILGLLDKDLLIQKPHIKFWEWLSAYYLCTLGEVMRAALPSGLKLESQTRIQYLDSFEKEKDLSEFEQLALQFIQHNPGTSLEELGKILKRKNPLPVIKSLIEKAAVSLEEKVNQSYKPKTQTVISLNKEYDTDSKLTLLLESLHRAPKQEKCLLTFLDLQNIDDNKRQDIPIGELLKNSGDVYGAINALVKKKILQKKSVIVSRIDFIPDQLKDEKALSPAQDIAFGEILNHFTEGKVSLLHGVTSSGKTEIYIHLIRKELNKGKQILYLLPEIALTTQIINRLRAVFGEKVGIYHSRFSDAERVEVWKSTSDPTSKVKVILGARSSVFLPFHKLGLIIVDEEHEISYKQFDPSPRYQARDAAIVLGKIHGAHVLLGSATPSLESYYNARSGKFGLVEIKERYSRILMPEILLANTREAYRKKRMQGHFTPELLLAIDDALVNKEQIILFQNRRGYSPYMICDNCGHIPKCRDCDVSLTVHKNQRRLVCHYCAYSEQLPLQCTKCGSTGLLAKGIGTEKIEDEIQILFPDAKVARLDLDAARSKKGYARIIGDFENRKTDILIGTQMISKGLDFDHVKVVGIVNADNLLHFPDFRSFERSFQLITQVSGRAGRKNNRGLVVVQTSDPTHRVLQQVLNYDFISLYKWEMTERQAFSYPPYSRLIQLTFKHKDPELVSRCAHFFARDLRRQWTTKILGPQAPPVARVQQFYLRTILIKSGKGRELTQIRNKIQEIRHQMKQDKTFRSVIIQADVDPV